MSGNIGSRATARSQRDQLCRARWGFKSVGGLAHKPADSKQVTCLLQQRLGLGLGL